MPKAYISINWVQLSLSQGHGKRPEVALFFAVAAALLAALASGCLSRVCQLPSLRLFSVELFVRWARAALPRAGLLI